MPLFVSVRERGGAQIQINVANITLIRPTSSTECSVEFVGGGQVLVEQTADAVLNGIRAQAKTAAEARV
jgi:hypothetical protein